MSDSQNWAAFDEEPASSASASARSRRRAKQQQQKDDAAQQQSTAGAPSTADSAFASLRSVNPLVLRNKLMFGGLVGFCTGATFGGIDAAKLYHRQHGRLALAGASSVARGAAVSGGSFAGFFLAYQGVKTLLEVQRGEEDLVNVGAATVAAALPFVRSTVMRQNAPYALMLVALDHFHEALSEHRK